MKQKVSPVMVIVAIVIVVVVLAALWHFTLGKSAKKATGPGVDTRTMQPKTPEEAAARGYKPQPGGGSPATGQPGMGGPPSGKQGK